MMAGNALFKNVSAIRAVNDPNNNTAIISPRCRGSIDEAERSS